MSVPNEVYEKIIGYIESDDLASLKQHLLSLTRIDRSKLVNSNYENKSSLNHELNFLFIAAQRNNFEICQFLIKECDANIEMNVTLRKVEFWDNFTFFSFETIYGYKALFNFTASILWHLCRKMNKESLNYFEMIKFLVSNGADVNTRAESYFGSTPLMVACLTDNLALVCYLVEEAKANLNILDSKGENCLFYAVRNIENNLEMIKYLIKKGINVNHLNNLGRNAFVYSIDLTGNEKFNYLVNQNPFIVNKLTFECPLILAALNGDDLKFKILLKNFDFHSEIKIFAMEIIGSKMCEQEESIHQGFMYWKKSLIERKNERIFKDSVYVKKFLPEFESINELNKISQCPIELIMQNLFIREKVLIRFNRLNNFAKVDIYRMLLYNSKKLNLDSFFAKNCDRIQYLWTVALSLQIKYLRPLDEFIMLNLLNMTAFVNYLHTKRSLSKYTMVLDDDFLVKILKICLHEMKRVNQACPKFLLREKFFFTNFDSDEIFEFNDAELVKKEIKIDCCASNNTFYIVHNLEIIKKISVTVIRLLLKKINKQNNNILVKIAKSIVIFDKYFIGEMSILAMSLKPNLLQDFEYRNQFVIYDPICVKCVELFLQCGTDPDSKKFWNRDSKNNCVNSCIMTRELYKNKALVDSLITLFLKHGAHLDYRNDHFKTFVQNYEQKYLVPFKDKFNHLSLKCLCAVVIKKSQIEYHELPKSLLTFVDLH